MKANEFDLVILGSGPGGYVSAIRAAQLGLKTAVVEKGKLGGVCLNWGCIPTKALLKSAEVVETFHRAEEFGVFAKEVRPDFSKIIERSRNVSDRVSKGVAFLMKKNKISVIKGRGVLTGSRTMTVLDREGNEIQTLKAPHIIISTGGRARALPGLPFDGERIINAKKAMILKELPKSLAIIGAGAIGAEFAYFYRTLGVDVTILEMLPNVLPIEDEEISKVVERSFKKMKMKIFTGAKVTEVSPSESSVILNLTDKKGKEKELEAEKVLVAIGVQGNMENLGLEDAGVIHERSFIKVDKNFKTSQEGIYAIGDVIGPPLLAHVASHEGLVCVERIAGKDTHDVDYNAIPGCTYCQPQVASIGLTEAKAKETYDKVRVGRFNFRGLGKAVASGNLDGMVKLVFNREDDKILGAHLAGHDATELLGELILAKNINASRKTISSAMHAHPTLTEAVMEAALDAAGAAIHL